jgi:hypothetical protein
MIASQRLQQIEPMRVYVLWHSSCSRGKGFAEEIYKWFRGDPTNISQCGHGIPVEYRSYPFEAGSTSLPDIDLEQAQINVIVPLVNEHMVVDAQWRSYLREIAEAHTNTSCLICPVALHKAAYQLPEEITRLNFLRIDRANDPEPANPRELWELHRQRLLSLLTQVCCRLLWRQQDESGAIDINIPSSPIKVFISHAKADGTDIAEAIREQIYQHGQLQAFFDESDIAIGYAWEKELKTSAHLGTTAMIAVFTDTYANRPWCRQEIRLARAVQPISSESSGTAVDRAEETEGAYCWRVKPLIVVDALERGASYFLPEFGYAPVFRWDPDQVSLLIDQLLREILLFGYNEQRAKLLPPKLGQHHLNCVPDLQTVLNISAQCMPNRLVIPPPGLPYSEEETLREFLKSPIQVATFDQVSELSNQDISQTEAQSPLQNRLIGISISESPDLILFGKGQEHLHELMISIARMVLRLGGNLAYGGDLRPGGFTETLFSLGRGEHRDKEGWQRRLYSFLAWPNYHRLSPTDEAQLINTCCFVRINPENAGLEGVTDDMPSEDTPDSVYQTTRCLSHMRELMTRGGAQGFDGTKTPPLSARILVGGRVQHFAGIMPGLFEEYLLAAENNVPTYIIGGFGGAAFLLSQALQETHEQAEDLLHEHYQSKHALLLAKKFERYSAERLRAYPEGPYPREIYGRLNAYLKRTREENLEPLLNGLTSEENKQLMGATNSKVIISLLTKGLMTAFTS